MSLPVFSPPYAPSQTTSSRNTKPTVRTTALGDGYVHRHAEGVNYLVENWQVGWDPMHTADALIILNFFTTQGGYLPFTWTAPNAAGPKVYVCPSWTRVSVGGDLITVTAQINETADWSTVPGLLGGFVLGSHTLGP